jgi:hypothetical protein
MAGPVSRDAPLSEPVVEHLDETGAPCARHPAATQASLLQLALVGSRASAFHHECASKLQSLVMALDEIREFTQNAEEQLRSAVEAALESVKELNTLLNTNRALTKPPVRSVIAVRDLVARAAGWVRVTLSGSLSDALVNVSVPAMMQALALVLDVAAGASAGRGRTLTVAAEIVSREVELVLQSSPSQPAHAREALAIASFVIARDGGKLWCAAGGDQLVVRLPCP